MARHPLEWALKNAVENPAQHAVKDAGFGSGKKSASSEQNGKAKKPEELKVPQGRRW